MTEAATPRVALVHDWLTGMRGGEKVLVQLARIFPAAPIYTLFHFPGTVSAELERHPIHTSFLQNLPGARRHYRTYLPLFPAAVEDFDLSAFDLVISSSHCVAKGVIPAPDAVHVCYCHSPMRYAWDQEHVYFPRRRGPAARVRGQILSWLRVWDAAAAHRVDRFVANSRFVAQRIHTYYGREAEVVHPPVDTDFFSPAEGPKGDHCLVVAALAPYKCIEQAIDACRRLGRPLWIVGDGPERERLERLAVDGVRLLGRVDEEELRQLYRTAACFIQPGVEDFGMAVVEALACGCPVVAQGRGGVLDILRDGREGVLYRFDDQGVNLADAIDKCTEMGFNQLDLAARAEQFSNRRFEAEIRSFLASIVSGLDL